MSDSFQFTLPTEHILAIYNFTHKGKEARQEYFNSILLEIHSELILTVGLNNTMLGVSKFEHKIENIEGVTKLILPVSIIKKLKLIKGGLLNISLIKSDKTYCEQYSIEYEGVRIDCENKEYEFYNWRELCRIDEKEELIYNNNMISYDFHDVLLKADSILYGKRSSSRFAFRIAINTSGTEIIVAFPINAGGKLKDDFIAIGRPLPSDLLEINSLPEWVK